MAGFAALVGATHPLRNKMPGSVPKNAATRTRFGVRILHAFGFLFTVLCGFIGQIVISSEFLCHWTMDASLWRLFVCKEKVKFCEGQRGAALWMGRAR